MRASARHSQLQLTNVAEASITEAIHADLICQQMSLYELHIERAYPSSTLVRERPADLPVYCQAWPVPNGIKNLFEVHRYTVVHNVHVIARLAAPLKTA